MALKALRNYVVVQNIEPEEKSFGGIILPGSAADPFQFGKVVSVGKGAKILDGSLDFADFAEGDVVAFGKGMGMPYREAGVSYTLLTIEEIAALVV
jgi:chaperonin GroES